MSTHYRLSLLALLIGCSVAVSDDKPAKLPQLSAKALKVGQNYQTDGGTGDAKHIANTWAKIIQIVDDDNMLIGIDNGADDKGGPRYSTVVMCKFPTKDLTDDQKGFLADFVKTEQVTVSGTTRYKTVGGGTKTVFVLEPVKPAAKK
jgi:hypothetical protein